MCETVYIAVMLTALYMIFAGIFLVGTYWKIDSKHVRVFQKNIMWTGTFSTTGSILLIMIGGNSLIMNAVAALLAIVGMSSTILGLFYLGAIKDYVLSSERQ